MLPVLHLSPFDPVCHLRLYLPRYCQVYSSPASQTLPCPCPKSLPSIDPLHRICPCLFPFDMQNPDLHHGGTESRTASRHCSTPPGISVAVAMAPVWSCFTLNIYALMPAALTHFPRTAECSARRSRRFYVASYELWVKGLLLLDIHQPEYHKMTCVSKCTLLLLAFVS